MKLLPITLTLFLSLVSDNDAFNVPSLPRRPLSFTPTVTVPSFLPSSGESCMPAATATTARTPTHLYSSLIDDYEDEEDDEDDDDDVSQDKDIINAALANQSTQDESNLTQSLSSDQRKENLTVIRQIFKNDLADLQMKRDYSGWVEAKKDMKKRQAADPWYALNKKLKDAVMLDEEEDVARLGVLIDKIGGPPPGIKPLREYAVVSEIYDTGMSLSRAESIARFEQTKQNTQKWQRMIAQREANEVQEEKDYLENPYKAEEEAKIRRERSLKKIYGKIEETRKKAEEKAKEIQNKYKDDVDNVGTPLDRALKVAKKAEVEKQRKLREAEGVPEPVVAKESTASSETKENSSSSGRPRLPGDMDVTSGEIDINPLDRSDTTTKDAVRIQVSSSYNTAQSDPPMRKHCFQYTIQIINLSTTDTIQLLSRRFEIQTVGARQKDIVQGQGVTGRQPILKPGETFEYTSTAPLSVRPLGTTSIAARMKGTYTYTTLDNDGKGIGEEMEAELGMFHFVFPPDQRVKPAAVASSAVEEEEEEEEITPIASSTTTTTTSPTPSPQSAPPSLPGDDDIRTGKISVSINDSSSTVTNSIRVAVTTQYREERSDARLQKHCFAYNIRITNESPSQAIQLLSRRFEIQTITSNKKDVVQGPGVTGRQPILKPGESFEYTSTAPLNVKPMDETPVVARMSGEYNYVLLDGEKVVSESMQANLGMFHFVLPQVA